MKDFKYGSDASYEVRLLYNKIYYHNIFDNKYKGYNGYNLDEIKDCFYNDMKVKLGKDFDIKEIWEILIEFIGGRYSMYNGKDGEGYYFPSKWTD